MIGKLTDKLTIDVKYGFYIYDERDEDNHPYYGLWTRLYDKEYPIYHRPPPRGCWISSDPDFSDYEWTEPTDMFYYILAVSHMEDESYSYGDWAGLAEHEQYFLNSLFNGFSAEEWPKTPFEVKQLLREARERYGDFK